MFDLEDMPKKQSGFQPANLEPLSLDELSSYIKTLEDEIDRVEAEVRRKKAHQEAASSIFAVKK